MTSRELKDALAGRSGPPRAGENLLAQSTVAGLEAALAAKQARAERGVANGYAALSATGDVLKADGTPLSVGGGVPADGSLTTAKYADGSVTAVKVAADVATKAELDAFAVDSPAGAVIYAQRYIANPSYANPAAAINAAMNALPTYGGTVILPPGIIDPGAAIVYPTAKPVELGGAGENATYLRWPVDLGSGAKAILRSDNIRQSLRKLTVLGPVDAVKDGAAALMDGVWHLGRHLTEDVRIQGFKRGMMIGGDHSDVNRVHFNANVDDIYYMNMTQSGVQTEGNHSLTRCIVTGAARAGIAFAPGANVFGEVWSGLHFGMGPVGLLWEVNGSNAAAAVTGITLDGCVFENVGNASFYSMSATQAGILQATLINCTGSHVFRAGQVSTGLARNQRAHIDGLANVGLKCIDTDMFGFAAGPLPLNLQYGGWSNIDLELGDIGATGRVGNPNGAKPLGNPLGYTLVDQVFRGRIGRKTIRTEYADAAAVTANLLVSRYSDGARTWAAGKAVLGVALQAGAAFDFVLVGVEGEHTVANSGAVAIGDALIPDAATPGKVTPAGAAPGMQIGRAVTASAANGTVTVELTPTGWRF